MIDKETFQSLIRRAKMLQEIHSGTEWSEFYAGMQSGLRRNHHGEDFTPSGGHAKLMSLSPWMQRGEDGIDWKKTKPRCEFNGRRMLGMGYRIGLKHDDMPRFEQPCADDIKSLRSILGWSTYEMAAFCEVSPRTVEGWQQGRNVSAAAAERLKKLIVI